MPRVEQSQNQLTPEYTKKGKDVEREVKVSFFILRYKWVSEIMSGIITHCC